MEDFANLRRVRGLLAGAGLLMLAACGGSAPADMRGVAIVPPPAPPNPTQAMQQQMAQQQMAPMQNGPASGGGSAASAGALAGHLASYRTAESAQTGWRDLVKAQPALQTLKPYFVPVTINGQPWVRVLAGDFPNRDEVNRFCNWARAQKLYCAPMPVSGASQATPPAVNAGPAGAAPAGAAPRQRQPRGTPQSGDAAPSPPPGMPAAPIAAAPSMLTPDGAEPMAAPPAMVAPAPSATPPQPLAPPLPPRRQPSQPALPQ